MSSPLVESSAPGKAILFGEHAVVYGQPAIAVPVLEVTAKATVVPARTGGGLTVVAADLGQCFTLATAPVGDPLAKAAQLTLSYLNVPEPDATIKIRSLIPIASGLGSGAAVAASMIRALATFVDRSLSRDEVSQLVFEVEKIHHGTPSGIDNTVIAFEQPVCFQRGAAPGSELLSVGLPFTLLIVNSGLPSPTKRLVSRVRQDWERDPEKSEVLFERIGDVAREACRHIEMGNVDALGPLMDENHALLTKLGVSSPTLNQLVEAARGAGASGAKLSGAGQGGCIVALVHPEEADAAAEMLREAGAARVIRTTVG